MGLIPAAIEDLSKHIYMAFLSNKKKKIIVFFKITIPILILLVLLSPVIHSGCLEPEQPGMPAVCPMCSLKMPFIMYIISRSNITYASFSKKIYYFPIIILVLLFFIFFNEIAKNLLLRTLLVIASVIAILILLGIWFSPYIGLGCI